jgi:DNA-binding MarR family transcriptional regulator
MQDPNKNKSPDPQGGDAQALDAADRLHSAAIHLLRRLRIRDRDSGVGPAQLSALSVLVFAGRKSLAELAEAEQVKPPTMSRIVAGLVRARLAKAHTNKQDRRAVVIQATQKGIRIMQEGRRRRVETLADAVRALPSDEIFRLQNAAEVMERLSRQV